MRQLAKNLAIGFSLTAVFLFAFSQIADAKSYRHKRMHDRSITQAGPIGNARFSSWRIDGYSQAPVYYIKKQKRARYAKAKRRHRDVTDANGNAATGIVRTSVGAIARVAARNVARFQAYVDDLEKNFGAKILDIGGIRRGRCSPGHQHPCGDAMDLCQQRRGVVDPNCKLPPRDVIANVAKTHGLFEGGEWCDHDYGHVQARTSAPACGGEVAHTLAARKHNKGKHQRIARR